MSTMVNTDIKKQKPKDIRGHKSAKAKKSQEGRKEPKRGTKREPQSQTAKNRRLRVLLSRDGKVTSRGTLSTEPSSCNTNHVERCIRSNRYSRTRVNVVREKE